MYRGKKIAIIIPARYGSKRFPGKPLALIAGQPMIQWVYQGAKKSALADRLIVATDDQRIVQAVKEFGAEVFLTKGSYRCGSERVAAVAKKIKAEVIVDLQGDEPLVDPKLIDQGVRILVDNKAKVATPIKKITDQKEIANPNVVKVVKDKNNNALYFSRSVIPHQPKNYSNYYEHIGLFIFRRDLLLQFAQWPPSPLEKAEDLEQLRILENGFKIRVYQTDYQSQSVNVFADLKKVEKIISKNNGS